MSLLCLQNIRLSFGGPELLDDVTIQIERGERVCLVGRNGAGKSTLSSKKTVIAPATYVCYCRKCAHTVEPACCASGCIKNIKNRLIV